MSETTKHCPFCIQLIPRGAEHCAHCGERVAGKICGDCRSLCPEEAHKCRWCGFVFADAAKRISVKEFEIRAAHLPTLLIRLRLLPQRARFNEEKLIILTPGIFNLWCNESEVPWNKVAGFDYRSGIFWDSVTIETKGQKPTTIQCLSKSDGEKLRDILRKLEE
jgi:hypothetical protein